MSVSIDTGSRYFDNPVIVALQSDTMNQQSEHAPSSAAKKHLSPSSFTPTNTSSSNDSKTNSNATTQSFTNRNGFEALPTSSSSSMSSSSSSSSTPTSFTSTNSIVTNHNGLDKTSTSTSPSTSSSSTSYSSSTSSTNSIVSIVSDRTGLDITPSQPFFVSQSGSIIWNLQVKPKINVPPPLFLERCFSEEKETRIFLPLCLDKQIGKIDPNNPIYGKSSKTLKKIRELSDEMWADHEGMYRFFQKSTFYNFFSSISFNFKTHSFSSSFSFFSSSFVLHVSLLSLHFFIRLSKTFVFPQI